MKAGTSDGILQRHPKHAARTAEIFMEELPLVLAIILLSGPEFIALGPKFIALGQSFGGEVEAWDMTVRLLAVVHFFWKAVFARLSRCHAKAASLSETVEPVC
eukprot:3441796-Amphidinium_carterae.1